MYFTTTRLHQELARHLRRRHRRRGTRPVRPVAVQGDRGPRQARAAVREQGAANVAYVSLATTVNMAGGQPVSMANVKALREFCQRHGLRLFLDATRLVENAFFIQEREPGYAGRSIASIAHEFCSYTDGRG